MVGKLTSLVLRFKVGVMNRKGVSRVRKIIGQDDRDSSGSKDDVRIRLGRK